MNWFAPKMLILADKETWNFTSVVFFILLALCLPREIPGDALQQTHTTFLKLSLQLQTVGFILQAFRTMKASDVRLKKLIWSFAVVNSLRITSDTLKLNDVCWDMLSCQLPDEIPSTGEAANHWQDMSNLLLCFHYFIASLFQDGGQIWLFIINLNCWITLCK